jgi:carbamoyltransferase
MQIITNVNDAVDVLLNQHPLAIFQNSSEWGPRALGNRSLLFDARNSESQLIVNSYKKREWWRPFAGSIMLEHSNEWFDMSVIKESPYMSYAIDARERAKKEIPSIIHTNGTCRVQTVTPSQNYHFYQLLNGFYQKTNVPILLNTSLNLAGEPLAETLDDVLSMTESSDIKFVFLPK